jgi:hypothetical protein
VPAYRSIVLGPLHRLEDCLFGLVALPAASSSIARLGRELDGLKFTPASSEATGAKPCIWLSVTLEESRA